MIDSLSHVPSIGTIPLFSPTQTTFNEQVLHSIFSPNVRGGVTSAATKHKYDHRKMKRGRARKDRVNEAAKRLTAKTPSPMRPPSTPSELHDFGSPIHLMSPSFGAIKADQGADMERTSAPPYVRTTKESPRMPSSSSSSSPGLISPLTFVSPATSKSSSTSPALLSLDKLSFDYVSSCESIPDLEQVVSALSSSSPRQYPSLLRSAKKRLQVLRDASKPGVDFVLMDDENVPPTTRKEDHGWPKVRFADKLTTIDTKIYRENSQVNQSQKLASAPSIESSLNMSLSSSSEEKDTEVSNQETSKDPDADIALKMEALEAAKLAAESDLHALEKELAKATADIEKAESLLSCTQREKASLQEQLFEKETKLKTVQDRAVGLQQAVSRISTELQQTKTVAEEMSEQIESRVRQQFEGQLLRQQHEMAKLVASLEDTRHSLESITEEKNEIFRTILTALGKPAANVDKYTHEELIKVLRSMTSALTSVESMSKTLSATQTEKDLALGAKQRLARELDRLNDHIARLENDKKELRQQLNDLARGPAVYWDTKEHQYKSTIKSLRAQIRSGEAVISMSLYRKAISESRARAIECEEKRKEVQALSEKLALLEQKAKQQPLGHRRVARVSPASTGEKAAPNSVPDRATSRLKMPPPPPPPQRGFASPTTKLSYRLMAVRDAGGKSGLRAKLQRIRRSPAAEKTRPVVS